MTSLTHEFTETLTADRERVFHALTREAELTRWFAEHVEIEPLAGGDFRFWGKHTYGAPARASALQKIRRFEEPGVFAFSWRIEDRDSEVTLELTPGAQPAAAGVVADAALSQTAATDAAVAKPVTVVKGRHHFPDAPDVPRPQDLIDDLWRMIFANLRAYLADASGIFLPDFSDPRPRVRQTMLISASRDQVFQALLSPASLNKWIAANATVEPRVDGRYSYGWKYDVRGRQVEGGPTRILELVEDTKLVTDWPNWRGDSTLPAQRITWLLEAIGDHTRVTLIHEPFERLVDISDYPQGWRHFLSGLKAQAEAA